MLCQRLLLDISANRKLKNNFSCIRTGYGQSSRKQVQPRPFSGVCEEKNGRYSVPGQCDAYVECTDGVPEEKLCEDGLLFNDKAALFTFPCQYPIDVNCTSRAKLQTAQV